MTKPSKSQWDFGELFPVEETRRVLTVAELTLQVRRLLEKQIGQIWVTGEISNLRAQSSGHVYFTLKDADSQLSCVLFRGDAAEGRAFLQDGRKVVLQGGLTVYEARGQYQLRVMMVELAGVGALQAAFEKLKLKLSAEGLFDAGRKRAMPRYPRRIGIVTSPNGAAIRDVLHVVQRRHSRLEIVLVPCRVQGQGAAEEIAAAIRLLNEHHATNAHPSLALDLILVTRGGGSPEDLWAFNQEVVARAIFESVLPVVSAVGHEIDFTIGDFVADLRAATPSAAAEIITEGVFSSGQFVAGAAWRLRQLADQAIENKKNEAQQITMRLARLHPRRRIDDHLQRLDDLNQTLLRAAVRGIKTRLGEWANLRERLWRVRPRQIFNAQCDRLKQNRERFAMLAMRQMKNQRSQLNLLEARLRLLGPEQVLARGYSITLSEEGKIIRAAAQVKEGQKIRTRLKTGEISSTVEKPLERNQQAIAGDG